MSLTVPGHIFPQGLGSSHLNTCDAREVIKIKPVGRNHSTQRLCHAIITSKNHLVKSAWHFSSWIFPSSVHILAKAVLNFGKMYCSEWCYFEGHTFPSEQCCSTKKVRKILCSDKSTFLGKPSVNKGKDCTAVGFELCTATYHVQKVNVAAPFFTCFLNTTKTRTLFVGDKLFEGLPIAMLLKCQDPV